MDVARASCSHAHYVLSAGNVPPSGSERDCAHCKKRGRHLPADIKLKRCAGCSVVTYCSRECQKAAWSEHRRSCARDADFPAGGSDRYAGYGSRTALANAMGCWVEIVHYHALTMAANATVLANGGIAANLTSPQVLVFDLAPYARPSGSNNVAEAFRLLDIAIAHKDEVRNFEHDWAETQAVCRRRLEAFRERLPGVVGCIPAAFVVGQLATTHYYPIYRLNCLQTSALPDWTGPIFKDIVSMCVDTVNRGLVMRAASCTRCSACMSAPVVGAMVREKKNWNWQLVDDWEWTADELRTPSASSIPPRKLWSLYRAI